MASSLAEIKFKSKILEANGASEDQIRSYITTAVDELKNNPNQPPEQSSPQIEPTQPIQEQGLIGKLSGLVTKAASLPITFPQVQYGTAKKVLQSGIEADKRYPAENLIPPVLGSVGGVVGGLATLPSGAGVPFGATAGAIEGGALGKSIQEGISAIRGNQPVSLTIPESLTNAWISGLTQGGAELGTATLLKVAKLLGAGKLAKEGMMNFAQKIADKLTPEDKAITEAAFNKIKDIPAVSTGESKTVKTIADIFEKRGISSGGGQGLSPTQIKNFAEAGLSPEDVSQLSSSLSSVKQSVSKIAKGKSGISLESELTTTPLNKYQELGNVLRDLDNPKLTYGKLRQIKQRVGDIANLDKADINRTPIEKLYGMVYHNIGLDMAKTADQSGMLSTHFKVMNEGSKFYQEKLFKDVIDNSLTRTKGITRIKYSDLANELKSYTEDELTRKFGENSKYIKALRDLAETHAETFGQGAAVVPRLSTSAKIYGTINPHIISRIRTPGYIEKILSKYLGEEGVKEYKNILFNNMQTVQKTIPTFGRGIAIPTISYQSNQNNTSKEDNMNAIFGQ
jgi:outer membrane lipoprotein SlyB